MAVNTGMNDYYAILGVPHDATQAEVREQYQKLSGQLRPESGGSEALTKWLNEAYAVLGDPDRRRSYDAEFRKEPFHPAKGFEGAGFSALRGAGNGQVVIAAIQAPAWSMPKLCACCLKSAARDVKIPVEAHLRYKQYYTGAPKMPLCEACAGHMRAMRRKAGGIGTAAGLLCFVLMDVLVLTAGLNGWLAFGITFVAACVGGAMGGKLFQGIVAQEDHACVDAPVEMILEQDMSKWFLFWNSYYADMFFQLNPHAARVEALPRGRIRKLGDADRLEGLFLKRLFAWMLPLCLLLAFGSMSDDKEGKSTTPAGTYASTDAPAQGEADATAATQSGWEGLWDTTFGELTLRRDGDRFVGEYPSLNGTLEGTVTDRQLSGTYQEGDTTGEYWFVMAKDGQSFYGEWKKPGMADWSSWTGKRASNDASDGMDAAAITTEKPITTEPTPTPTPTSEPTPDYPPVDRPETGRLESAAKTKGVAPFKIFTEKETENASDFYLKLVDAESGNTVYVFYVRSGETLDVKVALGTYVLRYASGETWYGPEHLYGPRTRYAEGGDPLAFSQSGNMVYGNSVTLYTVLGGNFDTKNIDAGGF